MRIHLQIPAGDFARAVGGALGARATPQRAPAGAVAYAVELPDGLVELPSPAEGYAIGMDDGRPALAVPRALRTLARVVLRPVASRDLADGRAVLAFELDRAIRLPIPGVGLVHITRPAEPDALEGEIIG